jgi:hypothetical protein
MSSSALSADAELIVTGNNGHKWFARGNYESRNEASPQAAMLLIRVDDTVDITHATTLATLLPATVSCLPEYGCMYSYAWVYCP